MPFCSNCGQVINGGAKFCSNCGIPTLELNKGTIGSRKQEWAGKLIKCPSCGEELPSFTATCPACGYELRESVLSSSLREFSEKLDAASSNTQRINIIRNYPVPNTKEDIIEFSILAASNIDDHQNTDVVNAWASKFNQVYDKGKLVFGNTPDFSTLDQLYASIRKTIKRRKRKLPKKILLIFLAPFIPAALVFCIGLILMVFNPKVDSDEVARLEAIVEEVEAALKKGEYSLALMHAKTIDYEAFRANDELERQWDIKRDYLIEQIIVAAAEAGMVLEYPTDTADEEDQNTDNGNSNPQNYQQNIDEFNQQMEAIEEQWGSTWNGDNAESNNANSFVGFEEGTYETVNVKGFTFTIPQYWSEEGSKNEYLQYYAEQGDQVVMLGIAYPEESDNNFNVSFEGLYADNDNMIEAIGTWFEDCDVIDYEIFESEHAVKGILYRFTFNQKIDWLTKADGSGYCFCFPSESDRRWFYVVLLYTNNVASDDYKDDYMNLISSIKEKS